MSAYHDKDKDEPLQLLSRRAEDQGFSVADDETKKDGRLRRSLVWPLFSFFIIVNVSVDAGVYSAYLKDTHLIIMSAITPDQRLITAQTVEMLIGATTVQLGAIAFAVFNGIFSTKRSKND